METQMITLHILVILFEFIVVLNRLYTYVVKNISEKKLPIRRLLLRYCLVCKHSLYPVMLSAHL